MTVSGSGAVNPASVKSTSGTPSRNSIPFVLVSTQDGADEDASSGVPWDWT